MESSVLCVGISLLVLVIMDHYRRSTIYDVSALNGIHVQQTHTSMQTRITSNGYRHYRRGWMVKEKGGNKDKDEVGFWVSKSQRSPGSQKRKRVDCESEGEECEEYEHVRANMLEELQHEQELELDFNSIGRTEKFRVGVGKKRKIGDVDVEDGDGDGDVDDGGLGVDETRTSHGYMHSMDMNMPPSDMLKGLHLLASEYYMKKGLMLNNGPGASVSEKDMHTSMDPKPYMYRVFEGSMLLGLGVLVQEKVVRYLKDQEYFRELLKDKTETKTKTKTKTEDQDQDQDQEVTDEGYFGEEDNDTGKVPVNDKTNTMMKNKNNCRFMIDYENNTDTEQEDEEDYDDTWDSGDTGIETD